MCILNCGESHYPTEPSFGSMAEEKSLNFSILCLKMEYQFI